MAYEAKYWDRGYLDQEARDFLTRLVDENVRDALRDFLEEIVPKASLFEDEISIIDTDRDLSVSVPLRDCVARAIEMCSGPGSDESTIAWLRRSREELLACAEMISAAIR